MNFDKWKRLIASPDPSDRVEAADDIPRGHGQEVAQVLVGRLADEDDLVRACAADSLRAFKGDGKVRAAVLNLLDTERDSLVKAYAMSTLAEVSTLATYVEVIDRWQKERDPRVRLHAALGAIQGLHHIALGEILQHSSSKDADLHDAAVNALKESLEVLDETRKKISSKLKASRQS